MAEMRTCTKCLRDLAVDDFGFRDKVAGKRQSWCRSCRALHKSDGVSPPMGTVWLMPCSLCGDVFRRVQKQGERRLGNVYCSPRCRVRSQAIQHKFGITPYEFRQMWQRQAGVCAMPGCFKLLQLFGYTGCHVDHDHLTDRVRGLLCHRCNVGLGWYEHLLAVGADIYLQEVVVSTPSA